MRPYYPFGQTNLFTYGLTEHKHEWVCMSQWGPKILWKCKTCGETYVEKPP